MRINVYAEEMTDRVEIITKTIDGQEFTGLRIYLELPATVDGKQYKGPFVHRPGDDDSSAVTFWGKRDLSSVLRKALSLLDFHYAAKRRKDPLICRNCRMTTGFGDFIRPPCSNGESHSWRDNDGT